MMGYSGELLTHPQLPDRHCALGSSSHPDGASGCEEEVRLRMSNFSLEAHGGLKTLRAM
jgi:hypothetical protein